MPALPPVDRPERIVVWNIDDPYGGDRAVYISCAAAIKEKLKTLRIGRDEIPVIGSLEGRER